MCAVNMPDRSISHWLGVGVFPTPAFLVRQFADEVASAAAERFVGQALLTIRDLCAGDGRLGHAVARRLVRRGFAVSLQLVDVDLSRLVARSATRTYKTRVSTANLFAGSARKKVDLVLSNPPYLSLSRLDCRRFGLRWSDVDRCGRNLYSLAIVKCIDDCRPGGVVGFLGPHGWLTNRRCERLRELIASATNGVHVHAFSSRRLFGRVNQDTSIQTFRVASSRADAVSINLSIRYDSKPCANFSLAAAAEIENRAGIVVRVGPFVWNRQRALISRNGQGVRVIYGGNISPSGSIVLNSPRYAGRQFLKRRSVPAAYIWRGPCLLLKRSLRGTPGNWSLDCAVVESSEFEFVPENHVIVVAAPVVWEAARLYGLASHLKRVLAESLLHCGHPNLSAGAVRQALGGIDTIAQQGVEVAVPHGGLQFAGLARLNSDVRVE